MISRRRDSVNPEEEIRGGALRSAASHLLLSGDLDCQVRVLAGDVNGDGVVNNTDLTLSQSKCYLPMTPEQATFDVTLDGVLNLNDYTLVKVNLNRTVP